MKRNVDLSESRMFITSEPLTGLFKLIYDALTSTKPWEFESHPKELDLEVQRRVFAIGNKEERQRWKQNRAYDTDQICSSCGQNRGKKPWAKKICNCYSMTYTPKIPWKF